MSLWNQIAVETPIFLVCFCSIWALLWRLRTWGYWTVLIGFALFLLLTCAQLVLTHGRGDSPVSRGLVLGCFMPTFYMFFYQLKQGGTRR
jgi:hypothetical protein